MNTAYNFRNVFLFNIQHFGSVQYSSVVYVIVAMSSIVTAVFKATVGIIVNKARDKAAEKLKQGDVMDQRFRDLIKREIDDIKSRLDGLSRKDLLSAIDAFEAGMRYLYQAMDVETSGHTTGVRKERYEEKRKELSSPLPADAVDTVALAAEMGYVQISEFSETTKAALADAAKRFRKAREDATDAFNNESLNTFDRITAIRYRIMAALLESAVETMAAAGDLSSVSAKFVLKRALPECEQCLQKLHSMPDVKSNFKVEFGKAILNIKGRFAREERREIILTVFQMNQAIYDVVQTVGKDTHIWVWPSVDTEDDKIDPLRDRRVTKVVHKVGVEQSVVTPWLFDQEFEWEHGLILPSGIASNVNGQFIVIDRYQAIKIFDRRGNFIHKFRPQSCDSELQGHRCVFDVATDVKSNTYVLVRPKMDSTFNERAVRAARAVRAVMAVMVFSNNADLLHTFPVKAVDKSGQELEFSTWEKWLTEGFAPNSRERHALDVKGEGRLTVSKTKVLLSRETVIDIYEHDGRYVRSFGERTLKNVTDITAVPDGLVVVMDKGVHVFTEDGEQQFRFSINTEEKEYYRVTCHPAGEHLVFAGYQRGKDRMCVAIYSKDGEFERTVEVDERIRVISGVAVSVDGRIAVTFTDHNGSRKVIVL